MKSDLQFLPTSDPEKFQIQFTATLDDREKRLLAPCKGKVKFDFSAIPLSFDMMNREGVAFTGKANLDISVDLIESGAFDLGSFWEYTVFNAADLRRAYVLARLIQMTIENTIILNLPLAPMIGFTKSWDVRIELPKGLINFEPYRRSILVRDQL